MAEFKVIIYEGDATRCPPCRHFKIDQPLLKPVFEERGIVFIEYVSNEDPGPLPFSDDVFWKLLEKRQVAQRIPQFHFYEVVDDEITDYALSVGYTGVTRFKTLINEVFGV